jgi:predicted DNA-binding transcriptional regulator AlpA
VAAQGNVIDFVAHARGRHGRRVRESEPRVTKEYVARHFGVSTKTIERYCRRPVDPMPFEKPFERGAIRFVLSDVERWWQRTTARAV